WLLSGCLRRTLLWRGLLFWRCLRLLRCGRRLLWLRRLRRTSRISRVNQLVQRFLARRRSACLGDTVLIGNNVRFRRSFYLELVRRQLKKCRVLLFLYRNKTHARSGKQLWRKKQYQDNENVNDAGNPCRLASAVRCYIILIQVCQQQMQVA